MFLTGRWWQIVTTGLLISLLLSGCAGQKVEQLHVKELTEAVHQDELDQFLKIVDRLQGKKLPAFDSPLTPPTRWTLGQEKSIERIAAEKIDQLEQKWSPGYLSQYFNRNPRLRWALASAEMSPEVFSGMVLVVGVGLSKSSLPPETDIELLLKRSTDGVQKLREDRRSMAMLDPDEQYQVAQQSLWISLQDLMIHLPMIPDDSLQLIKQNRERLVKVFPPEFSENLLTHYDKILNSSGLPFEDLPETGITDIVSWNPPVISRIITGKETENNRYESSDDAFTPPEHLFSSNPRDLLDATQKVERAEAEDGTNSASNSPGKKDSALRPGSTKIE